jgi:tetratricopeptide (TPR) repeat protein
LDELILQIQSDQSRRRQYRSDEPLAILTFNSKNDSEQSTTDLNGRFLQYQLLISCLLKMKTTSTDKKEFILRCREIYKENPAQLKNIDDFEKEYVSEHSLWWYTTETFLYRLLNKALRIQDIDSLFLIRFFIRDIEQELHQRRYRSSISVYRGQLMSNDELNILKNSQNQFISINSFLSTSRKPEVALIYTDRPPNDSTIERVLFKIDADPNQIDIKPFADISGISKFDQEEEILMMAGSVFHLKDIYCDNNQLWHIHMILCGENDYGLQTTFHQMRNQYSQGNTRLILFANVLIDMARFDNAENYLSRLLKQLPSDHKDIFKCYQALGKVSCEKGDYQLSHYYLDKALEFLEKSQSNDSRIAYIYNNIDEVYQNQRNYKQAFEYYEKALNIFKETFTEEDQNIAWSYNNLGIIYEKQKNYSKALDCLLKALDIKTKSLPSRHPCLSNTYNNIGNIYYHLKQYDKASENYQLSYDIFKKSLTSQHPSIARVLKNIGIVYEAQNEFKLAKETYEKVLHIRERILSPSHPDLIETKEDIARVSLKIK